MKGRKTSTRRKKALRWLALLLLLGAYLVLPAREYFMPSLALREAERLGAIGPTELLMELPWEKNRTLRVNERGMMLSTLEKTDRYGGWGLSERTYLDCTGPEPLHTGICAYDSFYYGGFKTLAEWYGRIDCPEAAAVRLEFFVDDVCQFTHTLERVDWMERNGMTFFIQNFPWKGTWGIGLLRCQLLDEEENVLYVWEQPWDLSLQGGQGRQDGRPQDLGLYQ